MTGRLPHVRVTIQVHVLMLDVTPESLDEDVVEGPSGPIHADRHAFALEHFREGITSELRALIAVKNLRRPVHAQRIFKAVHAKLCLHAVVDAPTEHFTAKPVDYRHQVGIDLVLWMRLAGVWLRRHARQSHLPH